MDGEKLGDGSVTSSEILGRFMDWSYRGVHIGRGSSEEGEMRYHRCRRCFKKINRRFGRAVKKCSDVWSHVVTLFSIIRVYNMIFVTVVCCTTFGVRVFLHVVSKVVENWLRIFAKIRYPLEALLGHMDIVVLTDWTSIPSIAGGITWSFHVWHLEQHP